MVRRRDRLASTPLCGRLPPREGASPPFTATCSVFLPLCANRLFRLLRRRCAGGSHRRRRTRNGGWVGDGRGLRGCIRQRCIDGRGERRQHRRRRRIRRELGSVLDRLLRSPHGHSTDASSTHGDDDEGEENDRAHPRARRRTRMASTYWRPRRGSLHPEWRVLRRARIGRHLGFGRGRRICWRRRRNLGRSHRRRGHLGQSPSVQHPACHGARYEKPRELCGRKPSRLDRRWLTPRADESGARLGQAALVN
jgi:hypothetical protein